MALGMMVQVLNSVKRYGWLIVSALLSVLAIFGATMKGQRDKARDKAEVAEATVHAERVKGKIIKEEKEKLVSRRANIKEEVKKLEEGNVEDFKGIDNLSDSNKF